MLNRLARIAGVTACFCVAGYALAAARPSPPANPFIHRLGAPIDALWAMPRHFTPPRPPVRNPMQAYTPMRPSAKSGSWQTVAGSAPFGAYGAGTPILMTDAPYSFKTTIPNGTR